MFGTGKGFLGGLIGLLIFSVVVFFVIYLLVPEVSLKFFGIAVNSERYVEQSMEKSIESAELPEGIAGEMIYDYLVIPRQKGHYDIPPVEFSYFDINTGEYKTLKTQPLTVDVAQGTKSDADVEKEMELRKSDIRALHVDDGLAQHTAFWGSTIYGVLYVILIGIFAATVWTTRRYIKANADIVGRRGRAAGKNARLRLAKAKAMLDHKRRDAFYDETEKALQGYVADKFNIPKGQLSRGTVTATLTAAGVTEETVSRFNETLEGCEYARFAPSGGDKELEGFYEQAADILSRIEQELKAKKKK